MKIKPFLKENLGFSSPGRLQEAPEELPRGAWESTLAPLGSLGISSGTPGLNSEPLWDSPGTIFSSFWTLKGAFEVKLYDFVFIFGDRGSLGGRTL